MYFSKNIIYHLTFIIIYLRSTNSTRNKDLIVTASSLKEVSPRSVGLQFCSVLNNTSNQDFFVELMTDQCCIDSGDGLDCDSLEIIGECAEIVRKGKIKAFTLVAPVLDPFQRKGYCVIHMDSRPIDKRNQIMRDVIKIDFDSGVAIKNDNANLEEIIKRCKDTDEDPLNDCKPVNCDTYYNGKKPLFDNRIKRCIEAPNCKNSNSEAEIYDPISNRCIGSDSIDKVDIDYIKTRLIKRNINRERGPKDVIIVESITPDYGFGFSSVQNSNVINSNETKKLKEKSKYLCINILQYFMSNTYTLCILALIIFIQCCCICTMVYCLTKKTVHKNELKLERKYFNYRQDVSVTTPLIATSNIDTETTAFDYTNESSNGDQRTKCYKACQRKRDDNKVISADDILSKCLNRRVWNMKPKVNTNEPSLYDAPSTDDWNKKVANSYDDNYNDRRNEETILEKVSIEKVNDKVNKLDDSCKTDFDENESSEMLIQCHDYNMMQPQSNFPSDSRSQSKVEPSMSTEKGAQACFSNDSVDDFLSERGMIFLAGEDLSKYSFGSNSSTNSDMGRSSKTSKNNIVRNVVSYLSRKSKITTSSDPGISKPSDKNLELIHMSKATVYSSSGSEYKNIKGMKMPKESRSSIF